MTLGAMALAGQDGRRIMVIQGDASGGHHRLGFSGSQTLLPII